MHGRKLQTLMCIYFRHPHLIQWRHAKCVNEQLSLSPLHPHLPKKSRDLCESCASSCWRLGVWTPVPPGCPWWS